MIPPEDNLSPVAKKRLAAIREFSDLGSGFRVAASTSKRGAGNLGGEQSGHIEAVGFGYEAPRTDDQGAQGRGDQDDSREREPARRPRIDDDYIPT